MHDPEFWCRRSPCSLLQNFASILTVTSAEPVSYSTYRGHSRVLSWLHAYLQYRAYSLILIQAPLLRESSPYFFRRCSPADSGPPMKRVHVPNNVYTCLRRCACRVNVHTFAFIRARARRRPCARSTRTDAGRKINIKFTSRLCTHVDREPRRKIRTRRNAEAADTQSDCDCVRTWLYQDQSGILWIRGWEKGITQKIKARTLEMEIRGKFDNEGWTLRRHAYDVKIENISCPVINKKRGMLWLFCKTFRWNLKIFNLKILIFYVQRNIKSITLNFSLI